MDTLPDVGRNPSYGLVENPEFSVDTVSFGDGYEQRRPAGLNSNRRVWSVQWALLTTDQADMLYDFIMSRRGVYAFWWQIPETDEVVRVVCKEAPSKTYSDYRLYQLSATFREDFAP